MALPAMLAEATPVFAAPMAGGPSAAELVVNVSRAGHFAQLAAGYKTVEAMADNEATEEDCANRFVVSARELLDAMAGRINVQRRTLEVFTHHLEFDFVGAELNPDELARRAEKALLANATFDPRALREQLEGMA